jgi:hypothetical protein
LQFLSHGHPSQLSNIFLWKTFCLSFALNGRHAIKRSGLGRAPKQQDRVPPMRACPSEPFFCPTHNSVRRRLETRNWKLQLAGGSNPKRLGTDQD